MYVTLGVRCFCVRGHAGLGWLSGGAVSSPGKLGLLQHCLGHEP